MECERGGFRDVQARLVDTGEDRAALLTARAPETASVLRPFHPVTILCSGDDGAGFAKMMRGAVQARGAPCQLAEGAVDLKKGQMRTLLWIAGDRRGDGASRVAAHCLALRDLALTLAEAKVRLVVAAAAADRPIAEALFAFARTLANEVSALDVRRVELVETTAQSAERLAAILLFDSEETDFLVGAEGVRVLRYMAPALGKRGPAGSEGLRSRLEKTSEPGLEPTCLEGGGARRAWRGRGRSPGHSDRSQFSGRHVGAVNSSRRDARGRLRRAVARDRIRGSGRPGRRGRFASEAGRCGRRLGRRRVRLPCGREREPGRAASLHARLRKRRGNSGRLSHRLLRTGVLRGPRAGRMGAHSRRRRRRRAGGAPDRRSARRARHRDCGVAGKARSHACPRRGARLRFPLGRLRRRGDAGDGRTRRIGRPQFAGGRGDGAQPRPVAALRTVRGARQARLPRRHAGRPSSLPAQSQLFRSRPGSAFGGSTGGLPPAIQRGDGPVRLGRTDAAAVHRLRA